MVPLLHRSLSTGASAIHKGIPSPVQEVPTPVASPRPTLALLGPPRVSSFFPSEPSPTSDDAFPGAWPTLPSDGLEAANIPLPITPTLSVGRHSADTISTRSVDTPAGGGTGTTSAVSLHRRTSGSLDATSTGLPPGVNAKLMPITNPDVLLDAGHVLANYLAPSPSHDKVTFVTPPGHGKSASVDFAQLAKTPSREPPAMTIKPNGSPNKPGFAAGLKAKLGKSRPVPSPVGLTRSNSDAGMGLSMSAPAAPSLLSSMSFSGRLESTLSTDSTSTVTATPSGSGPQQYVPQRPAPAPAPRSKTPTEGGTGRARNSFLHKAQPSAGGVGRSRDDSYLGAGASLLGVWGDGDE